MVPQGDPWGYVKWHHPYHGCPLPTKCLTLSLPLGFHSCIMAACTPKDSLSWRCTFLPVQPTCFLGWCLSSLILQPLFSRVPDPSPWALETPTYFSPALVFSLPLPIQARHLHGGVSWRPLLTNSSHMLSSHFRTRAQFPLCVCAHTCVHKYVQVSMCACVVYTEVLCLMTVRLPYFGSVPPKNLCPFL